MKHGKAQRRSQSSLRLQLYLVMVLTLAVVIAIFLWTAGSVMDMLAEKNERYLDEVIAMECRNLTRRFDEYVKILYANGYDPSVQALMRCEDAAESYALTRSLSERMKYDLIQREDILDYAVLGQRRDFNVSGRVDLLRQLVQPNPDGHTAVEVSGPLYVNGPWTQGVDAPGGEAALALGASIYTYSVNSRSMEYVGYSAVLCRAENLLVSSAGSEALGTRFYLVHPDGTILAQSDDEEGVLGQKLDVLRDRDRWKERSADVGFGMRLVSLTDYGALYRDLRSVERTFLEGFGLGALVVALLFTVAIRRVVDPIRRLSRFIAMMQFTELDAFSQRIELDGSIEMGRVAQQFNRMLEKIRQLTQSLLQAGNRLHEAQLEQERAKLYALRSQINPHFLYNTLECAKGLAYQNHVPALAGMLDSMARIFRYSIKGPGMVRLKDELEVSRAYLSIQGARFPGRFDVRFEIEDRAPVAEIPKMTLQPLIENSIYHGVEPSLEKCLLTIRARLEEQRTLVLEVCDDGQGMDAQSLEVLRRQLADPQDSGDERRSIGLGNIARRIHLIYGFPYGVSIESELGRGTRVVIRLPYKEDLP